MDRSSAPDAIPHRTPEDRVEAIAALRRLRMTGAEIAICLGMPVSTVSAVLCRIGLGKISRFEPPEPPNRYERARPGELMPPAWPTSSCSRPAHRCRGLGVRACLPRGFLRRAVAFYASHGITVRRVMSDNGACYRSTIHALACRLLGLRHLRTRPCPPRTNGKAERFIRTMLGGWAYGAIYATCSTAERTAALDGWLWSYNHRRPHGSLRHKPPAARLRELNNLPGTYS